MYLASLRDALTGKYTHESLTNLLGLEDADRMLCHTHYKVFSEWLCFSLAEQKADLDEFISSTRRDLSLKECGAVAPSGARVVERQLYLTDLELVLELIRLDPGGAFAHPGSSLPRPPVR